MPDQTNITETEQIEKLRRLVETLRSQCPWDKKQTPETIIVYLVEETYELLDAITSGKGNHIKEELGDVLFQILFIALLFEEKKMFSLEDVIITNMEKMIRRHPHVFGDEKADTTEKVKENWAVIKASEKENKGQTVSLLDSVPAGMPALHRAYMISEKVGQVGFDWDDIHGVMKKVEEEWKELAEAILSGNKNHISLEFGDLLFTMTNVARFAGIHPETALSASVKKFERRYKYMEKRLAEAEKLLSALSPEEKDALWERAKKMTS
ncbi:MAG: nucleoside triphosphate pyrophosphohydrolase [Desulfobacteraceae bacterium]